MKSSLLHEIIAFSALEIVIVCSGGVSDSRLIIVYMNPNDAEMYTQHLGKITNDYTNSLKLFYQNVPRILVDVSNIHLGNWNLQH